MHLLLTRIRAKGLIAFIFALDTRQMHNLHRLEFLQYRSQKIEDSSLACEISWAFSVAHKVHVLNESFV